MPDHRTTTRLNCPKGQAIELVFPNGTALRLRWDDGEQGIKVSAEEVEERGRPILAKELVVRPRTANGVILTAE